MAVRRFEDVPIGKINKLRLENLDLNKEKTLLEALIETDAKNVDNRNNPSVTIKETIEKAFYDAMQPSDGFG